LVTSPRTFRTSSRTSERMARVRRKDTPIELILRRAVWARGARFRLHLQNVPGRPDFGNRRRRVAVFVDGCFWHGCPICRDFPTNNRRLWEQKFRYNRERRLKVRTVLERDGWTVVEVWGHEIWKNLEETADRVAQALVEVDMAVMTSTKRRVSGRCAGGKA